MCGTVEFTMDKNQIDQRILEIESAMSAPDFWSDKNQAQALIRELQELKDAKDGVGKYDKGNAVMTIFSGAGGDDAEDFSRMLLYMYIKYIENKGWAYALLHDNQNDNGGYRNVTIEIDGKNVYGTLKHESGVHRLVRQSPFNSKGQRHTSFSMVEVIPKFENSKDFEIPEDEIEIEFTKAGGPGGQNVNKRETAVRAVHLPTKLSVVIATERSQAQNRQKAVELLRGKIFKALEEKRIEKQESMYISKTMEIEWGNQIRSYVLHPYKMVKDHRTGVETSQAEKVLEDGELDEFIEAEKELE